MATKNTPTALSVEFTREKETPGTVKFKESVPEGGTLVIGSLYIKKSALPNEGKDVNNATVTVELH